MVSNVTAAVTAPQQEAAHVLPEHRVAAFRSAAAARVRFGVDAQIPTSTMIATMAREQQAVSIALANPKFIGAMASEYLSQVNSVFAAIPADKEPKTDYRISADQALVEVASILHNRIADAKAFAQLLQQPAFVGSVLAEAKQPAPAAKEYDLPAGKKEETIRRLVQPNDPDGAEPAVHVAAAALGHHIVHMALANIFRPKAGNLRAPLIEALTTAWPEATAPQREQLAVSWLKARHDPAHSTANGVKEGGELYTEAMRRSLAIHTPATAISGPAFSAKFQTQSGLMMDSL